MTTVPLSSKGWIVIPAKLRRRYRLKPGSEVRLVDYGSVLAIVPVLDTPIDQAAGLLKSEKPLTRILLEEHRRES